MLIKTINKRDFPEVKQLITASFTDSQIGYHEEAELVDKLRQLPSYQPQLEVVAFEQDAIVGHGLLSKVVIEQAGGQLAGLVLAPLDVLTTHQKQGVGAALIHELEKRASTQKAAFITIIGHSSYYPKFGYQPAATFNVTGDFEVPAEVFMIKPLGNVKPIDLAGKLIFDPVFGMND
jgi:predicted N-acetyltransferase YhbS